MLYPEPCYNEQCYKEVSMYLYTDSFWTCLINILKVLQNAVTAVFKQNEDIRYIDLKTST